MLKNKKNGFTLIELLVVVAIISLLSSIVLTSLQGARGRGRDAKRLSDLRQLQIAIEMYASDNNGIYPLCGTATACESEGTNYPPLTTLGTALVPKYIASIPYPPINTTGNGYYYARGWRPASGNQINNTGSSQNYILGTKLENSSNAPYGGWQRTLNFRIGF